MEKSTVKFPTIKVVKERPDKIYTEEKLESIKCALIKEAEALFAGSTDAGLMVQKIEAVFRKYL